jgi:hypothetical protein
MQRFVQLHCFTVLCIWVLHVVYIVGEKECNRGLLLRHVSFDEYVITTQQHTSHFQWLLDRILFS